MKLIIAGCRHFSEDDCLRDLEDFGQDCESPFDLQRVVSEIANGGASGADAAGKRYGDEHGIFVEDFKAEWEKLDTPNARIKTNKFGKKYNANAGFDRNDKMAQWGDSLLLLWDRKSPGSRDMKERMEKLGKPVYIIYRKE